MGELRKVQRTSSGTFFICLPKSWAERYKLKPKGMVALSETSDGKLLVDPQYGFEVPLRIISLAVGPYLSRDIVGAYLLGYDIIQVKAKERINFEVRDTVKKAAARLIGLEIVEEDYSKIVLQCLLEPSGFPPEKILRRGYTIVASMHRDVVNAFIDGDLQTAKSVVARDDESNRLYFLLVRILRTILQNPSLSDKLGVSPIDCLDYRVAASLVESMGDECVRIALKTIDLKGRKLTDKLRGLFVELHMLCFKAHDDALKAFFGNDTSMAENVRNIRHNIDRVYAEIERVTRSESLEIVPQALAIASFLRQIYEHSVDVADLAMPKNVGGTPILN